MMKIIKSESFRNANFEIEAKAFKPFQHFSLRIVPCKPFSVPFSFWTVPCKLFSIPIVPCKPYSFPFNNSVQTVQRSTGVVVHFRVCRSSVCVKDQHWTVLSLYHRGHINLTILGALQVSRYGDLANWMIPVSKSHKLDDSGK
jgi:hypothetical protein